MAATNLFDPTMKPALTIILTSAALAASSLAIVVFAESSKSGPGRPTSSLRNDPERVEHGRYIVHQVGLCIDCHSPRGGEHGDFIEEKHLTGSELPFAPTVPMPDWAPAAPHIAGMPVGWSEENMVHFLMTGERPNNMPPPRPPIPPYRLNRPDAEAVVAYVRTLTPATQ